MAVFAGMMIGVGGYQAAANHTIGAFMLGVDPEPASVPFIGTPPGSALSMCAIPSSEDATTVITVHASDWRRSSNTGSDHSPPGLVGACN